MRLVRCCVTPRCRARHVTVSPSPISPLVRPPTARSRVCSSDRWCTSMLRAKSNTRSRGAAMYVLISISTNLSPRARCCCCRCCLLLQLKPPAVWEAFRLRCRGFSRPSESDGREPSPAHPVRRHFVFLAPPPGRRYPATHLPCTALSAPRLIRPMGTRDPRVDAYIEKAAPFARPILQHLRELV